MAAAAARAHSYQRPAFACFTDEQRAQLDQVARVVEAHFSEIVQGCSTEGDFIQHVSYLQFADISGHSIVFTLSLYPGLVIKISVLPNLQRRQAHYERAEHTIAESGLDCLVIPEYKFYTLPPYQLRHREQKGIFIEKALDVPKNYSDAEALWSLVDARAMTQMVRFIAHTGYKDMKPTNVYPVSVEGTCYLANVDPDFPDEPDISTGLFGSEEGYIGLTMCAPEHLLSVIEGEARDLEVLDQQRFQEESARRRKLLGIRARIDAKSHEADDWSQSATYLGKLIHEKSWLPAGRSLTITYDPMAMIADLLALDLPLDMHPYKNLRAICNAIFEDKPNSCWIFIAGTTFQIYMIR